MSGRLSQVANLYREALAVQVMLVKALGVDIDQLFVSMSPAGIFYVVLRQAGKDGAVRIGRGLFGDWGSEWVDAVRTYNAASQEERDEMLEASHARARAVDILANLLADGFESQRRRAHE